MCGIAGEIRFSSPPDAQAVDRMARALAHRGPDAHGLHQDGPAVLAHRRLSIIDVSAPANQPMLDRVAGLALTFNGEIYNYKELKAQLADYPFRTASDTEVILAAYRRWGAECVERLDGMFAFGLWDGPNRRLLLARDRLGKKPLYYHVLPCGGVLFASEVKGLLQHPSTPRKQSPEALRHYLRLGYTLTDAPMLRGVRRLPPAHCMIIQPGRPPQLRRYWDLATHFHNKASYRDENEARDAFLDLFTTAVRKRMMSDVPLGAFLSGGIDSSAVVWAMCECIPKEQTRTFCVGFDEAGFSELDKADLTARYLGVDHQGQIQRSEASSSLPELVYQADEPFADTSFVPMTLLARFARGHVTVCLSGDGGDEILGGYETYVASKIRHLTAWIPRFATLGLSRLCRTLLRPSLGKVPLEEKLTRFLDAHGLGQDRAHAEWRRVFSETEVGELLTPGPWNVADEPFDHCRPFLQETRDCHYLDRAMYMDIKTWLADDILVKVDRATMAHSLEARAPFLDQSLVEFAASLPVNLKIKGFQKKYILKQAMRNQLPESILAARKEGFNAPMARWLLRPLDQVVSGMTLPRLAGAEFRPETVLRLLREHQSRLRDNHLKLLSLINYRLWRERFAPIED